MILSREVPNKAPIVINSTADTKSDEGATLISVKLFKIIVTANTKNPKKPITLFEEITPSASESIDLKNDKMFFIVTGFVNKY